MVLCRRLLLPCNWIYLLAIYLCANILLIQFCILQETLLIHEDLVGTGGLEMLVFALQTAGKDMTVLWFVKVGESFIMRKWGLLDLSRHLKVQNLSPWFKEKTLVDYYSCIISFLCTHGNWSLWCWHGRCDIVWGLKGCRFVEAAQSLQLPYGVQRIGLHCWSSERRVRSNWSHSWTWQVIWSQGIILQ